MSAPILATVLSLKNGGVLPPIGGGAYLGFSGAIIEGFAGSDWLKSGFFLPPIEAPNAPAGVVATIWGSVASTFDTSLIRGVATDTNGVWVAVGADGKAARSTDNGATWTDITAAVPFGTSLITGVATDTNGVWVATGDGGKAARSSPLVGFVTPVDNLYMRIA